MSFKVIAFNISIALFLMPLKNHGNIRHVKIWVINEANAAPETPKPAEVINISILPSAFAMFEKPSITPFSSVTSQ